MKTHTLPPRAERARRVYVATAVGQAVSQGALGSVYTLSLIEKGFGPEMLMYINACFYLGISLLEVPTGVYADIRGRKESCSVGWTIQAIAFAVYATSTSFIGCVAAESLFALGMTLVSGANRAWLSDELAGCEDHSSVRARATKSVNSISLAISMACSYVSVSLLRTHGHAAPYLIGLSFMLVTVLIAWSCMRRDAAPEWIKDLHPITAYREAVSRGWRVYRSSSSLRKLFAIMCVYNLTFMAPNMFWQLLYKDLLPNDTGVVIAQAIIKLSLLIGATWAALSVRSRFQSLIQCQFIIGFTLVLSGVIAWYDTVTASWVSLIFFAIHEIGRGWFEPVRSDFVDRSVDETGRVESGAVLRSIDSIVSHVGGLVGLISAGYMQRYIEPTTTIALSGILLVLNSGFGYIRSRM